MANNGQLALYAKRKSSLHRQSYLYTFSKQKTKKLTFPKADASEMKSILQIHTSDVSQNELQAAKSTLERQKCKCKCGRMRVKWNLRR